MTTETFNNDESGIESNLIAEPTKETCGIVMPISAIDNYSKEHWSDVKSILDDVILDAGFEPNLVSDANDVGFIHKRIVHNLYENPVVVCDVSARNPNVMFELGMRLAFDKATVIIKDNETKYSFDTSPIEHLEYPRDLRFNKITHFKSELKKKIKATYQASKESGYSQFLKQVGPALKVTELGTQTISKDDFILKRLHDLTAATTQMFNRINSRKHDIDDERKPTATLKFKKILSKGYTAKANYINEFGLIDDDLLFASVLNDLRSQFSEDEVADYVIELKDALFPHSKS